MLTSGGDDLFWLGLLILAGVALLALVAPRRPGEAGQFRLYTALWAVSLFALIYVDSVAWLLAGSLVASWFAAQTAGQGLAAGDEAARSAIRRWLRCQWTADGLWLVAVLLVLALTASSRLPRSGGDPPAGASLLLRQSLEEIAASAQILMAKDPHVGRAFDQAEDTILFVVLIGAWIRWPVWPWHVVSSDLARRSPPGQVIPALATGPLLTLLWLPQLAPLLATSIHEELRLFLLVLAAFSAAVLSLLALATTRLRVRFWSFGMLALQWSAMAWALYGEAALQAAILLTSAGTIGTALTMSLLSRFEAAFGEQEIAGIHGLARRYPGWCTAFVLALLVQVGGPLLAGGHGMLLLVIHLWSDSALADSSLWLTLPVGVSALLGVWAALRTISLLVFGRERLPVYSGAVFEPVLRIREAAAGEIATRTRALHGLRPEEVPPRLIGRRWGVIVAAVLAGLLWLGLTPVSLRGLRQPEVAETRNEHDSSVRFAASSPTLPGPSR